MQFLSKQLSDIELKEAFRNIAICKRKVIEARTSTGRGVTKQWERLRDSLLYINGVRGVQFKVRDDGRFERWAIGEIIEGLEGLHYREGGLVVRLSWTMMENMQVFYYGKKVVD
jgi:hypothetical protein